MQDENQTQTVKAIMGLRGMITVGDLQPGERISEPVLAERLGVSRTPARAALMQLREEGLLETLPSGGFIVAEFTEADVFEAIEIRGTLEGLAVRLAAERGVSSYFFSELDRCLVALDAVVDSLDDSASMAEYVAQNDRFHDLLAECGQSVLVRKSLDRVAMLPFAAPHIFIDAVRADIEPGKVAELRRNLVMGHQQHHGLVDALRNREGTRGQALALEHARAAWKYLQIVLDSQVARARVPGLSLVRARKAG